MLLAIQLNFFGFKNIFVEKKSQSSLLMNCSLRNSSFIENYHFRVSSFLWILFLCRYFYTNNLYLGSTAFFALISSAPQTRSTLENSFIDVRNCSTYKPNSMLLDKSILVEEIKTVIKNNSTKTASQNQDHPAEKNYSSAFKISSELHSIRNSFPNKRNRRSYLKLEQRVELLEEQSNDLLYFIHFLFQNFPNLVRNIMSLPPDGKELELESNESDFMDKVEDSSPSFKNRPPTLTRREIEVIELLVKGMCAKEIANSLFISETTVVTHKKNLKKKFNVRNTAELIAKAFVANRS